MISSDGVTNVEKTVSAIDAVNRCEISLSRCEEGWVVDVSRAVIPLVELAGRSIKILPHLASIQDSVIGGLELLRGDDSLSHLTDLLTRWPDVSEEDIVALLVLTERLSLEVKIDGASEGICNNQWWRCKIVGSSVRVDTTLEVSVTRKNRGGNKIVVDDTVLHSIRDLSRVTNATHATVSSGSETKLVEVLVNTGVLIVLGDDMGTWGEGSLDVRLHSETLLCGVLGEETSSEHHIGVRGICARSDSSNNDITVVESVLLTLVGEGGRLGCVSLRESESLEANRGRHAGGEV